MDDVVQSFDEWMELSDESSETQRAITKQAYLIDTWKLIHATAIQRVQTIELDKRSVSSQKSHHSQTSRSSASKPSRSSCKETLIDFRTKRALLEETLKFTAAIAEKQNKLEQLKIQKELGEIAVQEAVYQEAVNSESQLYDEQPPLLPTTQHDVVAAFLETDNAAGLTSTPGTPNLTVFNQGTCPADIRLAASPPAITPTGSQFQVEPPALSSRNHTTPVVPTKEPRIFISSSPIDHTMITCSFSGGGQVPPVFPAICTDPSGYHSPRGFCGNTPIFVPSSTAAYGPVPQNYSAQLMDALAKISQLQHLPQAKPNFGEPAVIALHSFSDTSDAGLGQVTYLRLINNLRQVHVSFLMGKACVAPLKPMSIPHRELTAAVISVNAKQRAQLQGPSRSILH